MSFDERDLFSKRCEHQDLETLPICDMVGNVVFNIHHYSYVYDNIRSEEITAERGDRILAIMLVGDNPSDAEVSKLKTYMSATATAILAKIDISLFDGVSGWGSEYLEGDTK